MKYDGRFDEKVTVDLGPYTSFTECAEMTAKGPPWIPSIPYWRPVSCAL
jgi:hypothetical protein